MIIDSSNELLIALKSKPDFAKQLVKQAFEQYPEGFNPDRNSKSLVSLFQTNDERANFIKKAVGQESTYSGYDIKDLTNELSETGVKDTEIGQIIKPMAERILPEDVEDIKKYYSETEYRDLVRGSVTLACKSKYADDIILPAIDKYQDCFSSEELKPIINGVIAKTEPEVLLSALYSLDKKYNNKTHLNEIAKSTIGKLSELNECREVIEHAGLLAKYPESKQLVINAVNKDIEKGRDISPHLTKIAWAFDDKAQLDNIITKSIEKSGRFSPHNVPEIIETYSDKQKALDILIKHMKPYDYVTGYDKIAGSGLTNEQLKKASEYFIPKVAEAIPLMVLDNNHLFYENLAMAGSQSGFDLESLKPIAAKAIAKRLDDKSYGSISLGELFDKRDLWLANLPENEREEANYKLCSRMTDNPYAFLKDYDSIMQNLSPEQRASLTDAVYAKAAPYQVIKYDSVLSSAKGFDGKKAAESLIKSLDDGDNSSGRTVLESASNLPKYLPKADCLEAISKAANLDAREVFDNTEWIDGYKMQTAAYSVALHEQHGIFPESTEIWISCETGEVQMFEMDRSQIKYYFEKFHDMVVEYHKLYN
jgi:hypothetical protein